MKSLIWIVVIAAVVFFFIGIFAKTLAFFLWVAPILIIVAVVLFILNRSGAGQRRIP